MTRTRAAQPAVRSIVLAGVLAIGCHAAAAVPARAALATAFAADSVSLHPDYQTGQTARFDFKVQRSEVSTLSGPTTQELTTTVKHEGAFDMKVVEASPSGTTIALTLRKLKSSLEDPTKKLAFDSASPPDDSDTKNPLLMSLRPIVGATVTLKFDQKGALIEVATDAELVKKSQFTEFANQLVGEEWVKFRWAPVLFPKPEKGEVKVGDVWTYDQVLNAPFLGTLHTNLGLKLESIEKDAATLKGVGEFSFEPPKEDQNAIMKPELFEPTLEMTFKPGTGVTNAVFREKFRMKGEPQGLSITRGTQTEFAVTRADK